MKGLLIIGLGLVVIAAACGGPAANRGEMTEGERSYRAGCVSCHRLYKPASKTADQWREIVEDHRDRLDLSDGEAANILQFLLTEE
jgi:hypothetical protein